MLCFQSPRKFPRINLEFVNNNPVIVTMNNICFATKTMSVFLSTPNLSGFFGVLSEIKKKMLNLRYNL